MYSKGRSVLSLEALGGNGVFQSGVSCLEWSHGSLSEILKEIRGIMES